VIEKSPQGLISYWVVYLDLTDQPKVEVGTAGAIIWRIGSAIEGVQKVRDFAFSILGLT
jgi:hypothetical protein